MLRRRNNPRGDSFSLNLLPQTFSWAAIFINGFFESGLNIAWKCRLGFLYVLHSFISDMCVGIFGGKGKFVGFLMEKGNWYDFWWKLKISAALGFEPWSSQ